MSELQIASPWVTFARKIYCLFVDDPDVRVEFDNENVTLNLYVDNALKAEALDMLFPQEKEFGNVTMFINIIPGNDEVSKADLFKAAFAGNPVVSRIERVDAYGQTFDYVLFAKEVVQFANDNMGDYHGIVSTLYQDIAEEVFDDHGGIFFCTDIDEYQAGISAPLGEWP